ncbi:response regulator [Massilia solisilvae]|uniref:Response regulator n=1 Tax=Massilia solisilvae TaxID=1811225 RepID=A0ABT2BN83_9BURK|nr:response regulator [Massilia solisilvae]MCS0609525.1 response regulator [Massilia solisilvae]
MSDEKTVYLVDDDPGVLKSLGRLLQSDGLAVRAFQSAGEFLAQHDPALAGCIVLDMRLPDLGGLALQQALLASGCERPVVFMTGFGDVADSVQAMKAGAVDFLTKPCDDDELLRAVHGAIARDEERRRVSDELQQIRGRMALLTPREHEVMQQVVDGRMNKQIAADLGVAEKTIKVHRARAMVKMGASSLADLVRKTFELEVGAVVDGHDRPGRRQH